MRLAYHQHTKNLLVSYSTKKLGLFQAHEKQRLRRGAVVRHVVLGAVDASNGYAALTAAGGGAWVAACRRTNALPTPVDLERTR